MLEQAGHQPYKPSSSFANAFSSFNDEYYADLEAAFRDAASTGCNQPTTILYAASIRDLSKGSFDTRRVDAALSALDAQKSVEQNKIDKAAAYSQLKKDDVAKKQITR